MGKERRGLQRVCLAVDALIVLMSMALAVFVHGLLRPYVPLLKGPPEFTAYAALAYAAMPIMVGTSFAFGQHRFVDQRWSYGRIASELLKVHVVAVLLLSIVLFVTQSVINRSIVVVFLASSFVLMFISRATIQGTVRHRYRQGYGQTRILLIGDPSDAMTSLLTASRGDAFAPRFIGYISAHEDCDGLERLGGLADLPQVLHGNPVDQVLFLPPFDQFAQVPEALALCETLGVSAGFWIDTAAVADAIPQVSTVYDHPFMMFEVAPKSPEALTLKHGIDAVSAAIALIALAPVFLIVSLAVAITMGRPIFFAQERSGLYGRRFRMYKFRTMVKDAEARRNEVEVNNEMQGPVFKMTDDPRITRLGKLLRRTSIDELPQLLNVLFGTMSLVGPRPLPLQEQNDIRGWRRRRLSMRPGITGLWQVSGRSNIGFEDWMKLDLQYVDNWSLGLDLRILARTVPVVLFGKGAR